MSSPKIKKVERKNMKDTMGKYLTQSLFLEYRYDVEKAMYTIDGEDKVHKGILYPSLKRLYLECEDVHEYNFAKKHLYDWEHWKRLCKNGWLSSHIELWREELEVMIASRGVQNILDIAEDGNFQAAKFAAERGWSKKRGRPSKEEVMRRERIDQRISQEFDEDADRVGITLN